MMQETPELTLQEIHKKQKDFFNSNQTKDAEFRLQHLKKLQSVIIKYQSEIEKALWSDLHKSPEEAFLTEISIVQSEIKYHIRNLKTWAKPKKVSTPIQLFPSKSRLLTESLGVALVIAPWNYPFQLVMNPLVGAISAGCCAILKPSPDASATALVMEKMITETFDSAHVSVVQGGRETNTFLLQQNFDVIFFTGSSKVGKVVMRAAAENLTPVILELGGKSPCIVDKEANIEIAAKRIVWGKLINAGQTCIAPDYLFVHQSVKKQLLEKMAACIQKMYGEDCQKSRFYPRIVNEDAFERLKKLLNEGEIYVGGKMDKEDLYISPTIIVGIQPNHTIMQEEIFGPILPILTFENIDEPLEYIRKNEKPLAFYYFGKNSKAKEVLSKTSSGGVCVNDTLLHIVNHHLPFGGTGNSGMGKYHGQASFLAFSNQKALVSSSTWLDFPFKYVPFNWFKLVKRFF